MKAKTMATAVVLALPMVVCLLLAGVGTAPLALADNASATGSATGGNLTPEVTSVDITTTGDVPDNTLDAETEYKFKATVRDNNTLADISTVVLKLYTAVAGEAGADENKSHYTFTFTAIDDVWTETGPGPDNVHLVTTSCVKPSDLTVQSDNYVFVVKLSGAAESIPDWTAKWIATDDNSLVGNNTKTFEVNEYISLAIDDATLTFSGSPGDTDRTPTETPTVATVTANDNFSVQVKLSADWSGVAFSQTIGMDNTKAAQDAEKTGVVTMKATYENVWSNVGFGANVQKDLYWFLDLPVPLRDDVYTVTFTVNATKA